MRSSPSARSGCGRRRDEAGCLEYTFAADPLEADRVVLFERWASQDALDAHLAGPSPAT